MQFKIFHVFYQVMPFIEFPFYKRARAPLISFCAGNINIYSAARRTRDAWKDRGNFDRD